MRRLRVADVNGVRKWRMPAANRTASDKLITYSCPRTTLHLVIQQSSVLPALV